MSFGSSHRSFSFDKIFANSDLDDRLRTHLTRVYATLGMTLGCATAGAAFDLYYRIGGIMTTLVTLGLMVMLGVDRDKQATSRRLATIAGFGFFKGVSLGPLVSVALATDTSIVGTALLGTCTIFACFSVSAIYAKRRSYLYLSGLLSSVLSCLLLLSVLSLFTYNPWLRSINLYLGLFMFCGYVLFDTQMIIERALSGDTDFVWHAVELFVDFVAIFVRILIILLENSGEKKSNKKKQTTSG